MHVMGTAQKEWVCQIGLTQKNQFNVIHVSLLGIIMFLITKTTALHSLRVQPFAWCKCQWQELLPLTSHSLLNPD